MKVTLLSTYKKGGAGIACERLTNSLNLSKVDATVLVQQKTTESKTLKSINHSKWDDFKSKIRLSKDLFRFIPHEKSKEDRFQFSIAKEGLDLSNHPLIKNADIIHLHWINQGLLSTDSIKKLIQLNKPIVWTLHDMWAFTGGCHYSGSCTAYEIECNNCPYLKDPSPNDLSNQGWLRKKELYSPNNKITFVTCSDWLKEIAQKSALLKSFRIESIPNPINTDLFKPVDNIDARKKWNLPLNKKLVLFGAMNVLDKRKGFNYLVEALSILINKYPQLKEALELVVFGNTKNDTLHLPFKTHFLGTITSVEEMVQVYNSSDLFVLPSLEDNLPNTVMESLSCGTPVVAFNNGGTPQMIDHLSNGYLAAYKNAEDLAEGIYSIINSSQDHTSTSRKKVLENYSQGLVAAKYISLYKELLKTRD